MTIHKDFKTADGKWVATFKVEGKTEFTRLGKTYYHMLSRCKIGGSVQKNLPSYIGCTCEFSGFQDFAEWAVLQQGYDRDGWHLDKDILVKGNKVYSKSTCCFVPSEVNTCFAKCNRLRGKYPIGVSYHTRDKVFRDICSSQGKSVEVGRFKSEQEAFLCYKAYKESTIKSLAEKYIGQVSNKVIDAMLYYKVEVDD